MAITYRRQEDNHQTESAIVSDALSRELVNELKIGFMEMISGYQMVDIKELEDTAKDAMLSISKLQQKGIFDDYEARFLLGLLAEGLISVKSLQLPRRLALRKTNKRLSVLLPVL